MVWSKKKVGIIRMHFSSYVYFFSPNLIPPIAFFSLTGLKSANYNLLAKYWQQPKD